MLLFEGQNFGKIIKFWLILTFITVSNKAVIKCWWLWISPGYYMYMKLEDRTK